MTRQCALPANIAPPGPDVVPGAAGLVIPASAIVSRVTAGLWRLWWARVQAGRMGGGLVGDEGGDGPVGWVFALALPADAGCVTWREAASRMVHRIRPINPGLRRRAAEDGFARIARGAAVPAVLPTLGHGDPAGFLADPIGPKGGPWSAAGSGRPGSAAPATALSKAGPVAGRLSVRRWLAHPGPGAGRRAPPGAGCGAGLSGRMASPAASTGVTGIGAGAFIDLAHGSGGGDPWQMGRGAGMAPVVGGMDCIGRASASAAAVGGARGLDRRAFGASAWCDRVEAVVPDGTAEPGDRPGGSSATGPMAEKLPRAEGGAAGLRGRRRSAVLLGGNRRLANVA